MKAVGIICEYNPFHNGHLYHIEQVKKLFPNSPIILIISGPFTERGDASVLTKWEKTELALTYGIDLVIELPFIFATGSADLFAKGAITILKELQTDYLVFGSEGNDIKQLTTLAKIQMQEEFQKQLKALCAQGVNYPTALSKAIFQFTNQKVDTPNDLLGISYIKAILESQSSIIPITIQRTSDYHSTELLSSTTSASSIRKAIKEKKDIQSFVPMEVLSFVHPEIDIESYFPLLKYKLLSETNLEQYHEVSTKIISRIQKNILKSESLDEFIHHIKSKNETYSKLKRMMLFILCGVTKEEAEFYKQHPYIRILGFSEYGRQYLNQKKKQITIPLFTNYSDDKEHLLALDIRVNQIYALAFTKSFQKQYLEEEIKKIPIYQNKH